MAAPGGLPPPMLPAFALRLARFEDAPAIQQLIARSARGLGSGDYAPQQVEAALGGAFGLDTQLIRDRSYFVATQDAQLIGCGGWSRRRTLFGSDAGDGRDVTELDPSHEPARIRAFFVDPAHARRGLGRALLQRCEAEAQAAGFRSFELMATLPGARLYEACGYRRGDALEHRLADGLAITFVPMTRQVANPQ